MVDIDKMLYENQFAKSPVFKFDAVSNATDEELLADAFDAQKQIFDGAKPYKAVKENFPYSHRNGTNVGYGAEYNPVPYDRLVIETKDKDGNSRRIEKDFVDGRKASKKKAELKAQREKEAAARAAKAKLMEEGGIRHDPLFGDIMIEPREVREAKAKARQEAENKAQEEAKKREEEEAAGKAAFMATLNPETDVMPKDEEEYDKEMMEKLLALGDPLLDDETDAVGPAPPAAADPAPAAASEVPKIKAVPDPDLTGGQTRLDSFLRSADSEEDKKEDAEEDEYEWVIGDPPTRTMWTGKYFDGVQIPNLVRRKKQKPILKSDINLRMSAWHQANQHPEMVSTFLKAGGADDLTDIEDMMDTISDDIYDAESHKTFRDDEGSDEAISTADVDAIDRYLRKLTKEQRNDLLLKFMDTADWEDTGRKLAHIPGHDSDVKNSIGGNNPTEYSKLVDKYYRTDSPDNAYITYEGPAAVGEYVDEEYDDPQISSPMGNDYWYELQKERQSVPESKDPEVARRLREGDFL